jgi:hypothetical protein
MGLFTMPGGSDDTGSDDTSTDSTSGDGSLSSLFGFGIGSGYGVTTYDDPPPPTSTASDLGSLQSGSTTSSPFDLNAAFADTLGAVVALDSINNGVSTGTTGVGYYKAANGQVYAVGTGPGPGGVVTSAVPGNLLFWLLVIGAAVVFAKEEKL